MFMRRMYLWEAGQHSVLLSDTLAVIQSWIYQASSVYDETYPKAFNSKALNGKLRAGVRGICGHGISGLLYTGDSNSKTGRLFMEVLR